MRQEGETSKSRRARLARCFAEGYRPVPKERALRARGEVRSGSGDRLLADSLHAVLYASVHSPGKRVDCFGLAISVQTKRIGDCEALALSSRVAPAQLLNRSWRNHRWV